MPLTRRGHRQLRGAVSIVVVAICGWLCGAAYAVDVVGNLLATQHRAQSAADAAAHAAVGELVGDANHDDIALLVGRDAGACWYAAASAYGAAGASLDDRCRSAVAAASDVVHAAAQAQLLRLTIVGDSRDNQGMTGGAGRLQALATVAVDRRLPLPGRVCDDIPRDESTLCFAVATSAAQER